MARDFNLGFYHGGMAPVKYTKMRPTQPRYPGGGAGGGGAGGTNLAASQGANALVANYSSAYEAAKAANEKRYKEGMDERTALRTRSMDTINSLGDQERKDITERFDNLKTTQTQDMISRGLRGTTIAPTVEQGAEREKTSSLGRLEERLRRERLGTDINLTQDIEGFRERRTDAYPDLNQMIQLMTKLGGQGGGVNLSSLQAMMGNKIIPFGAP